MAAREHQPALFHEEQVFARPGVAGLFGPRSRLFGQPIAFTDFFAEPPKHNGPRAQITAQEIAPPRTPSGARLAGYNATGPTPRALPTGVYELGSCSRINFLLR